ncbi:MAG: hypothetical protein AABX24_02150 [Nanoarchaeota archaeon]
MKMIEYEGKLEINICVSLDDFFSVSKNGEMIFFDSERTAEGNRYFCSSETGRFNFYTREGRLFIKPKINYYSLNQIDEDPFEKGVKCKIKIVDGFIDIGKRSSYVFEIFQPGRGGCAVINWSDSVKTMSAGKYRKVEHDGIFYSTVSTNYQTFVTQIPLELTEEFRRSFKPVWSDKNYHLGKEEEQRWFEDFIGIIKKRW